MTDKEDQLRLSAGTVPDPFGLAWEHTREASEEELLPDPDSPGSTDLEHVTRDAPVTDAPEADTVRLGELD